MRIRIGSLIIALGLSSAGCTAWVGSELEGHPPPPDAAESPCEGMADGTDCSTEEAPDRICVSAECVARGCGDGFVEGVEECDPVDGVNCCAGCELCCQEDEDPPFWFTDCDGDGFPGPDAIQSEVRQCNEPEPYNPGSCEHWTLLDPSNVVNQDCDDLNALVHPGAVNDAEGADGYWDVPYCVNTGAQASGNWSSGWDCGPAAVSFDYDCSGGEDRNIASTTTNAVCEKVCQICGLCDSTCQGGGGCTTCTQWGCSASGWSGALPVCGETATWRNCTCGDACSPLCLGCSGSCNSSTTSRQVRCR